MFKSANYKGQTLVIILLGTSVALTMALAVSVRTISTLRQTTTTAQSQQSLAAAEAGAEVALGKLKDGTCTSSPLNLSACNISPTVLAGSGTKYSVVTTVAGGGTDPYLLDLTKDNTQEIKLGGSAVTSVKVCWWDPNLDGSESGKTNALELIYIKDDGTMDKSAYNGINSVPSNGFTGGIPLGSVSFPGPKTVNFSHCLLSVATPYVSPSNPRVLRVKALYEDFSVAVVPNTDSLPNQGFQIVSTGQTLDGSVKKAVRVTKSLPSLPGIFDFAIYSGSSTQPLSK